MSSPIFFDTRTYLDRKKAIRPLSQCFFNKIELKCPKCSNKQVYSNTEICGDTSIVCDYCHFDIPFKYDDDPVYSYELKRYIREPTVISRL